MSKSKKKRKPISLFYGNGFVLHNLTKSEALKICADILQEYDFVTIKMSYDHT